MSDELASARDPDTSAARLQALASHPELAVRAAVVGNPSSPRLVVGTVLAAVWDYAHDEGRVVAEALLGTASVAPWLLAEPTWLVRCPVAVGRALARSPRLTREVWAGLREHWSKRVRLWVVCARWASVEEGRELLEVEGTRLALASLELDAEDVGALVGWAGGAELTDLSVFGNEIGDAGAIALAQTTAFPLLTRLDVGQNQVGADGAVALAQATGFPRLTCLDLSINRVGDEGARALAQTTAFPLLTVLNLCYNRVSDEAASALAHATSFPSLTGLYLNGNWVVAMTERRRWPTPPPFPH